MVEYFLQHIWMIWAVVAFVCLIMEMTSGDFFITCFGIGALCAMGVSLTPAPFWLQVVAYVNVAVAYIYRPFRRYAELLHSLYDGVGSRLLAYSTIIIVGARVRIIGRESIIVKVEPVA